MSSHRQLESCDDASLIVIPPTCPCCCGLLSAVRQHHSKSVCINYSSKLLIMSSLGMIIFQQFYTRIMECVLQKYIVNRVRFRSRKQITQADIDLERKMLDVLWVTDNHYIIRVHFIVGFLYQKIKKSSMANGIAAINQNIHSLHKLLEIIQCPHG